MVRSITNQQLDLIRRQCRPDRSVLAELLRRYCPGATSSEVFFASLLMLGMTAAPAHAQNGERQQTVAGTAADAAMQPLEDLNIKSRKIPAKLLQAQDAPYVMEALGSCASLNSEITALDDVLGPDADAEADETGLMRGALKTGGNLLSGFIPFRGLVRALSGANEKRAEMASAVYAGVARRSYLKGYAAANNCPRSETSAILLAETPDQQENVQPFLVIAQGGSDDVSK